MSASFPGFHLLEGLGACATRRDARRMAKKRDRRRRAKEAQRAANAKAAPDTVADKGRSAFVRKDYDTALKLFTQVGFCFECTQLQISSSFLSTTSPRGRADCLAFLCCCLNLRPEPNRRSRKTSRTKSCTRTDLRPISTSATSTR